MRRRWSTPSGVLGAVALSLGLSLPAWAMWEGIDPIQPIMPRWTWEGIEMQERLRDLTPEQQSRIRRLPAEQQEEALEEMIREQRGTRRGEAGLHDRMRHMPTDEMQQRIRSEETREERSGPEGEMRRRGEAERQPADETLREEESAPPETEMRQPEAPSDSEMRRDDEQMRQEQRDMHKEQHETSSGVRAPAAGPKTADDSMKRTEVEIKPVPKSRQAPAPGETAITADNPIDEAGDHLSMARTSAMSEDWEATKIHLRQANEALDQIVARGDRNAQRYLDRLHTDIRNAEKAVDARARDLDIRLQNLERNVRRLKPEER